MRTLHPRHAVAFVLTLVLLLAGFGRGLMALPDVAPGTIAGIVVSICHATPDGASGTDVPGVPSRHDCCDDGTLCASVALPVPAVLPAPAAIALAGVAGTVAASRPHLPQAHTPRLSQGPPIA